MIRIESAENAAQGMIAAGNHATPSVKLAIAAAILSANNRLDRNGWQVCALRAYMQTHDGRLPSNVETIKRITRDAGYEASGPHCDALIELEQRAQAGELVELAHKPTTALEWLLWRQAATTFRGLGWKTASFAALLLWPFSCPLVPVDRHVVKRLAAMGKLSKFGMTADEVYHKLGGSTTRAYKTYRCVERLVGNEKLRNGYQGSTALWHWYKWSEWRQIIQAEITSDDCESHVNMSAYWY